MHLLWYGVVAAALLTSFIAFNLLVHGGVPNEGIAIIGGQKLQCTLACIPSNQNSATICQSTERVYVCVRIHSVGGACGMRLLAEDIFTML